MIRFLKSDLMYVNDTAFNAASQITTQAMVLCNFKDAFLPLRAIVAYA
jgi:hypothetical protein